MPQILNLAVDDLKTEIALSTGWIAGNHPQRVIARKVLGETILFEWIETPIARPPGLAPWLQAIRAFSLTATVTPCLAVLALSDVHLSGVSGLIGVCALLGVLFLQIAINLFNDVEDYRRLIDLPDTLGGSGVIQNGWWTPAELRRLAWSALAMGSFLGLPAVLRQPRVLFPVGLIAGLGVLLYSGKKLGLKYMALGDLTVWILCGPALTLGFSFAITGPARPEVFWVGSFFGFLATALLHVNNLQDMKLDLKRGVNTLAIRLGFKGSLRFLTLLYLLAGASLLTGVVLKELPRWALSGVFVCAILAAPWLKSLAPALGPESSLLSQCRLKAAQIHLLSGVALILGLSLGMIWG
jgi:1,4-dihydroxy-2-naphthoate octaprenyltransferase